MVGFIVFAALGVGGVYLAKDFILPPESPGGASGAKPGPSILNEGDRVVFNKVNAEDAVTRAESAIALAQKNCLAGCSQQAASRAQGKRLRGRRRRIRRRVLRRCRRRCNRRAQRERRKGFKAARKAIKTQVAGRKTAASNKFGQSFSPSLSLAKGG